MTIHLPNELESRVRAVVNSGRFGSFDEAMAEAARLLLHQLGKSQPERPADHAADEAADPILGLMRDDTELMDEIVADAYRQRRDETWRDLDL